MAQVKGQISIIGQHGVHIYVSVNFNKDGTLTENIIKESNAIIDAEDIKNTSIPKGFSKYETPTIRSPSGNFKVHFYKNIKTGELFYDLDYKVKFDGKIKRDKK